VVPSARRGRPPFACAERTGLGSAARRAPAAGRACAPLWVIP